MSRPISQPPSLFEDTLGRPGSFRRWLVGTFAWVAVCVLIASQTSWTVRIVVFFVALVPPLVALAERKLTYGREARPREWVASEHLGSGKSNDPADYVPLPPVEDDHAAW